MATENQLQWVNRKVKERLNGTVPMEIGNLSNIQKNFGKKQWAMYTVGDPGAGGTQRPVVLPTPDSEVNYDWTLIINCRADGYWYGDYGTALLCCNYNTAGHTYALGIQRPDVGGIRLTYDNDTFTNANSQLFFAGNDFMQKDLWIVCSTDYNTGTFKITAYCDGVKYQDSRVYAKNLLCNPRLIGSGLMVNNDIAYGRFGGHLGAIKLFNRVLTDNEAELAIKNNMPDSLVKSGMRFNAWEIASYSVFGFTSFNYNTGTQTLTVSNNSDPKTSTQCSIGTQFTSNVKAGDIIRIRGNVTSLSGYYLIGSEDLGNNGQPFIEPLSLGTFDVTVTLAKDSMYLWLRTYTNGTSNCTITDLEVTKIGQVINLQPENILPSSRWIDTSGNVNDTWLANQNPDYKIFSTRDTYSRTIPATVNNVTVPASFSGVGEAGIVSTHPAFSKITPVNSTIPCVLKFNLPPAVDFPSTVIVYKEPECYTTGAARMYLTNHSTAVDSGTINGNLEIIYK